MLYEKYYRKTLKLSGILKAIYRFRILISAIVLAVLAALATFMGVYGMVYQTSVCPSEITYGEQLNYETKSLFTSTSYEYAAADSGEWTAEMPKTAGNYKVRSVSKNIFGSARYGSEFAFAILPKEADVYVSVSTVEYGAFPEVAADLAYSDTVQCSAVIYGDASLASTSVTPDKDSVKIIDENGEDVTSNYIINCVETDISFVQRNIEITLTDAEKVYDGTPLVSTDYTITSGGLAEGDVITAAAQCRITDVGEAENSVEFTITNADGTAVTVNYNITVNAGTLTVTAREVYVSTGSATFEYDGKEHSLSQYEIGEGSASSGLLSGHTVGNISRSTGVTAAGEYKNKLELVLTNENGADVTSNYSFIYDYGTLTVTKRKITVETGSQTRQYSASAFYDGAYSITEGSLAEGQTAEVQSYAQITNAGSVENSVVLSIFSGETDVTENYDITYKYGTLTVTRLEITVTTDSDSKTYDGTPLTNGGYTTDCGVIEGHILTVTVTGSQTETGSSKNTAGAVVTDGSGADVTANYDITIAAGTLTVNGLVITVTTDTAEKVYDAETLTAEGYVITSGALANGHEAVAHSYASITDVGREENTFSFAVYEGETDVTDNYIINYVYGTLTVTARDITVTAGSGLKEYDGTALTNAEYTYSGLLEGHALTAETSGSRTELGSADNIIVENSVRITDGNGNDVTANYNVITINGTLNVTNHIIIITAGSDSKVYDATALTCGYYTVNEGGLLEGHTLTVTVIGSQTDAGESANVISSVVITDGSGENVENLYYITTVDGTLEVTPREITISTSSAEKIYDATPLTANGENDWRITEGSLVDGHKITVTITGTLTDAGTDGNSAMASISDSYGAEVTGNYSISIDCGTLKVIPRPVTVNTGSDSWVYDAEEHYYSYYEIVQNAELTAKNEYGILTIHSEYIYSYSTIINVGTEDNIIVLIITDGSGVNVTNNYDITYNCGTLTVTPRPITVNTGSGEWVYDGYEHYNIAFSVSTETQYQLVAGHGASAADYTRVTDVGVYDNEITLRITDGSGADVTNNYEITYVCGTLTITKRPVTFTTGSDSWVYDGYEHYCEVFYISSGSLADWQTAYAGSHTVIKNVNSETVENALGIIIISSDGSYVTYNYEITYIYGTLTVTKRSVTFDTGSGEWVYDGYEHYCDDCYVTGYSLYDIADRQSAYAIDHATITDVGMCDNILVIGIIDENGEDVTENYDISYNTYGTLEITARYITVTSDSKEWLYEGLTHSCESGSVTEGELADGQRLEFEFTCEGITDVGVAENSYSGVTIVDAEGNDVTQNYNITYEYGTLEVFSPLTLSAKETYEFTAEASGNFTFTLQSGEASFTVNDEKITISQSGDSHTFELTIGDIVVIEANAYAVITAEYSRTGGTLDISGGIGLASGSDGTVSVIMNVYSDESGSLYFKLISYGDYTGSGWSQTDAYDGYITIGGTQYSLSYLFGLALENSGYSDTQIQVDSYTSDYLLPFQLSTQDGEYTLQTSDVYYTGSSGEYSLYIYYYDYLASGTSNLSLSSEYAAIEEAYSEYVYENYMSVPESTKEYLQTIIDAQKFYTADTYTLISQVTSYIKNAATYNLEYDRALDKEDDIVVAFLRDYKEGVCQHYASAATLLFRTLGIPARYTVGYYAVTTAGEWSEVTTQTAHAWVEVYINGLGWVTLDVTGSAEDGSGGGSTATGDIVIKPVDIVKQADGTELTAADIIGADEDSAYLLNYLLHLGYTYEVEFGGSQTIIGTSESTITSFVLYNPDGSVCGDYSIGYETGTLTVTDKDVITIYLYDLSKEYDGKALSYGENDYYYICSSGDYTVELTGLSSITLTNYGVISEDMLDAVTITVYRSGAEVTDGSVYAYIYAANLLTIFQRSITVTSASATKEYDGTALVADSAWVSFGSLVAGDTMTVELTGSIVTGMCDNVISDIIIINEAGEDVTENYQITKVEGTLEVTYNTGSAAEENGEGNAE